MKQIPSLLFYPAIILLFFIISPAADLNSSVKEDFYVDRDVIYLNADYLEQLEREIIFEMNKVRTDPQKYAELSIKPMLKRFRGNKYSHQNKTYPTKEGAAAVEECYKILSKSRPAGLLLPDESLSRAASDHVRDQGQTGVIGHTGNDNSSPLKRVKRYVNSDYMYIGENISYGLTSAEEIVSFLLINDGMPSRSHREILLNPKFNLTGVSCGYHRVYKTMCVIVYSRLHR